MAGLQYIDANILIVMDEMVLESKVGGMQHLADVVQGDSWIRQNTMHAFHLCVGRVGIYCLAAPHQRARTASSLSVVR
jgi:hypothetical protein